MYSIPRPLEPFKTMLYGVTNTGHNHAEPLSTVSSYLAGADYTRTLIRTGTISPTLCKSDLQSVNIFASRSHGVTVLNASSETLCTGIKLNDPENIEYGFYSHSWSGMSSSSTYINGEDYSNLEIALFIGCGTAAGGNEGRNLPSKIVTCGAKCAIGFKDSIDCTPSNEWIKDFFNYFSKGYTVQESVAYANGRAPSGSGLQSAVICGNASLRLCP